MTREQEGLLDKAIRGLVWSILIIVSGFLVVSLKYLAL